MQSSLVSRNVTLSNGRTSLRLEPEFWAALAGICKRERTTVAKWIDTVAADAGGGRTSAVRVGVLRYLSGTGDPDRDTRPHQWIAELAGKTVDAASGSPSAVSRATIG